MKSYPEIEKLIRPHLHSLIPYKSARDLLSDTENAILLDANENPFQIASKEGLNRYPDPHHTILKNLIVELKNVKPEQIALGNGSDEIIDLILKLFCDPQKDEILVMPPTFGMYKVAAHIQNITVRELPLTPDFQIDEQNFENVLKENPQIKVLFVCSPNNPTANAFSLEKIEGILKKFKGIFVVDEAYIDFSTEKSALSILEKYPNLIVLQTFSKAWGLANIRLGMCFSNPEIIEWIYKIKAPYNVNGQTQKVAIETLNNLEQKDKIVKEIIEQRKFLVETLSTINFIEKVYLSDANFLLVKVRDSTKAYEFLFKENVIVRNRSKDLHCENGLRISVGTPEENQKLIDAFLKLDTHDQKESIIH